MLKEANTVRYPVYFRQSLLWREEALTRMLVSAYLGYELFVTSFGETAQRSWIFFYYLQVEWSANSLFGRRQIPQETFLIVVLFDRSSSMTVRKPQTE